MHLAAASQAKSTDASAPAIRVELPDGGFVDFWGVCEYPCRDHAWWQPDGSPLAKTPDALPSDDGNGWFPNSMLREFAFDTSTLDSPAAFHVHLERGRLDYSSSDFVSSEDVPGRRLRKHRLIKVFPANAQTDTIAFTSNGGPWTPFLPRGAKADVTLALPVEFEAASSEEDAIRRMKDRVWPTVAYRKRQPTCRRVCPKLDGKQHGPKLESIRCSRLRAPLPPGTDSSAWSPSIGTTTGTPDADLFGSESRVHSGLGPVAGTRRETFSDPTAESAGMCPKTKSRSCIPENALP